MANSCTVYAIGCSDKGYYNEDIKQFIPDIIKASLYETSKGANEVRNTLQESTHLRKFRLVHIGLVKGE